MKNTDGTWSKIGRAYHSIDLLANGEIDLLINSKQVYNTRTVISQLAKKFNVPKQFISGLLFARRDFINTIIPNQHSEI